MISEYLKKYSSYYLSRYSVTKKKFENILKRKISKDYFQKKISNLQKEEYIKQIPNVLNYYSEQGCFNEKNLILNKLDNLLRKGHSLKKIEFFLMRDCFDNELLSSTLNNLKKEENLCNDLMEKFFHRIRINKKSFLSVINKVDFKKILKKFTNEGFDYNHSVNFLKKKFNFYDYP